MKLVRHTSVPLVLCLAVASACGAAPSVDAVPQASRAHRPDESSASPRVVPSASSSPDTAGAGASDRKPRAPFTKAINAGPDLPGPLRAIRRSAYSQSTCAAFDSGEVRCWGRFLASDLKTVLFELDAVTIEDERGALLPGGTDFVGADGRLRPRIASEPAGADAGSAIVATDGEGVELTATAEVLVGNAKQYERRFSRPATQLAVGVKHVCVRRDDGTVACIGSTGYGQVRPGSVGTQENPDMAPGPLLDEQVVARLFDVVQVSAGRESSCALLKDGTVRCWGSGYQGNLGDGKGASAGGRGPVQVQGLSGVTAIFGSAYGWTTCAVYGADAALSCWGSTGEWTDPEAIEKGPVTIVGARDVVWASPGQSLCYATRFGEVRCAGDAGVRDKKHVTYGKSAKEFRVVLRAAAKK